MYCMRQSSTLTPFRALIPAISQFDLFGPSPDVFENLSKAFKISITDVWFLTKKWCHWHMLYTKNHFQRFLVYHCFDLINANTTSNTKMNKCADMGSP